MSRDSRQSELPAYAGSSDTSENRLKHGAPYRCTHTSKEDRGAEREEGNSKNLRYIEEGYESDGSTLGKREEDGEAAHPG
jgi:hypothetical protein